MQKVLKAHALGYLMKSIATFAVSDAFLFNSFNKMEMTDKNGYGKRAACVVICLWLPNNTLYCTLETFAVVS